MIDNSFRVGTFTINCVLYFHSNIHFFNIMDFMAFLEKHFPAQMNWIYDHSSLLIVFAGVAVVLFTYVSSRADQKQKNKIQGITDSTRVISEKVNNVAGQVKEIVDTIQVISTKNHQVTIQTNDLTSYIKELSSEINNLVRLVDKRTDYDEAENRQSGRLKFLFNPRLSKEARLGRNFCLDLSQIRCRIGQCRFNTLVACG